MSVVLSSFLTFTCDGGCGRTVTVLQTDEAFSEAVRENPWLNSFRNVITTPDQRKFGYCSDECEANGIKTGSHNKLERAVITPGNQNQIELAAKAAANAARATAALKQGANVSLS